MVGVVGRFVPLGAFVLVDIDARSQHGADRATARGAAPRVDRETWRVCVLRRTRGRG